MANALTSMCCSRAAHPRDCSMIYTKEAAACAGVLQAALRTKGEGEEEGQEQGQEAEGEGVKDVE